MDVDSGRFTAADFGTQPLPWQACDRTKTKSGKNARVAVLLAAMRMMGSMLLAALWSSNEALRRQSIPDSCKKQNPPQDHAEQF
jgi:hypothetical protein